MCYSPLTLSKLQVFAFMCAVLTSKVHLLMIVWCLMFSAWRESTTLKLAQVKIVFSVVSDDDNGSSGGGSGDGGSGGDGGGDGDGGSGGDGDDEIYSYLL